MLGSGRNQRIGFSCFKILVLIFSLLPEFSSALGFGQIKLYSYINEPLDAEIELLSTQSFDPAHIIASLAPAQDFDRAELSRPYYLNDLRFMALQQNKRIIIKVTTDEPMNHPYLDFLVTISWPEGRIVKGYTLLLDPAPLGSAVKRDLPKSDKPAPKENRHAILRMHEKVAQKKLIAGNLVEPKPTLAEANGIGEEGQLVKLSPIRSTNAHDNKTPDQALQMTDATTNSSIIAHSEGISPELRKEVQPLEKLFDSVDRQKVAEISEQPIPRAKPVAIDSIEESNEKNADSEASLQETKTVRKAKAIHTMSANDMDREKQDIQFDLPVENINNKREMIDQNSITSWGNINSNTLLLLSGLSLLLIVAATVRILKRYASFDMEAENLSFRIKPNSEGDIKRQTNLWGQRTSHGKTHEHRKYPLQTKKTNPFQIIIDNDHILQEELNTKLRLARQYLDIQDYQSAREVLEEIIDQGNKSAIDAAKILLAEILTP